MNSPTAIPDPQAAQTPPDLLQTLLDNTPSSIFSLDRGYRYTAFNRTHARAMKILYGAEIQLGNSFLDYLSVREDRIVIQGNLDRAFAGERFVQIAFAGEGAARSAHEVTHSPIYGPGGEVSGVSVFALDVTSQIRAQEALKDSENLYQASFAHAQVGVVLLLPSGRILKVNPAFCAMLGYSQEELSRLTFQDITLEEDRPISGNFLQEALAGRADAIRFEKRYLRKDGGVLWADVSSTAFRSAAGEFQYLITYILDITRQKQAQQSLLEHEARLDELVQERTQQLHASENRFRMLFENMQEGFLLSQMSGEDGEDLLVVAANSAFQKISGHQPLEILGTPLWDLMPQSRTALAEQCRQVAASGKAIEFDYRSPETDRQYTIRLFSPLPGYIAAVIGDITERKRAEEELHKSHVLLAKLSTQLPGLVYLLKMRPDGSFCVPYSSAAIHEIFGCAPEDVTESFDPIEKVVLPEDMQAITAGILESARTLSPFECEYRVQVPGQPLRWLWAKTMPEPQADGSIVWYGFNMDITEMKRKDALIHENEERMRLLFESAMDGILFANPEGFIYAANPAMLRMTGWSAEEIMRLGRNGLVDTSDPGLKPWRDKPITGGNFSGELTYLRRDGTRFPVEISSTLFTTQNGALNVGIFVRDISERRRDQAAIADALEFNQRILQTSPIGIAVYKASGQCIAANPAAAQIIGVDESVLLQGNFHHNENWKRFGLYEAALNALETNRAVSLQSHGTSQAGKEIWLIGTFTPFKSGNEPHLLFLFEDDSGRQLAKQALETSNQKLTQLVTQLEKSKRRADLLRQMGELLQVCEEEEEAFEIIRRFAQELFPGTDGGIFLTIKNTRMVQLTVGWGRELASEAVFHFSDCWCLRLNHLHLVKGEPDDLICAHIHDTFAGAYLGVPLTAGGETLGVLHIASALEGGIDQEDMGPANILADTVSLSISNIRLRRTLYEQSIHDPLTGAFNRRQMEDLLDQEISLAKRKSHSFGLIMLDIDFFKQVNDTFGHAAGDAVLVHLANMLKAQSREQDQVCRLGGEEFVVLLPETAAPAALDCAETLRAAMSAMRVVHEGRSLGKITISLGVAVYPQHAKEKTHLLEMADQALYRAKGNGRDRVELASSAS